MCGKSKVLLVFNLFSSKRSCNLSEGCLATPPVSVVFCFLYARLLQALLLSRCICPAKTGGLSDQHGKKKSASAE